MREFELWHGGGCGQYLRFHELYSEYGDLVQVFKLD